MKYAARVKSSLRDGEIRTRRVVVRFARVLYNGRSQIARTDEKRSFEEERRDRRNHCTLIRTRLKRRNGGAFRLVVLAVRPPASASSAPKIIRRFARLGSQSHLGADFGEDKAKTEQMPEAFASILTQYAPKYARADRVRIGVQWLIARACFAKRARRKKPCPYEQRLRGSIRAGSCVF